MTEPLLRPGVVFPTEDSETALDWQAAVYAVARAHGGRVVGDVTGPGTAHNFHSAVVAVPEGSFTLLLNTGARLVACVAGARPFPAEATFVDVPSATEFERLSLRVASAQDMEATLHDGDLRALADEEADQARYHRPRRVGDVLYNWFD